MCGCMYVPMYVRMGDLKWMGRGTDGRTDDGWTANKFKY